MCRMILALGKFSKKMVAQAALDMSLGKTVLQQVPLAEHGDGWGMMWLDSTSKTGISTYRNTLPMIKSIEHAPWDKIDTQFLAIHVRHASLPEKKGIPYAHPIYSAQKKNGWYLMHNGYLPTIYKLLDMKQSIFDSWEYYLYLTEQNLASLEPSAIVNKLLKLDLHEDWNSANAILLNSNEVHVINWTPPKKYEPFFNLHYVVTKEAKYISSEPHATLGDLNSWNALPELSVLSYKFHVDSKFSITQKVKIGIE